MLSGMSSAIHYVDSGQPDGAAELPVIVFVHGFACSHDDWQRQVDFFSATHRTVACDLPGHGQSPMIAGHNAINEMARDVVSLLLELDIKSSVLVGHSMGCRVVLQCAVVAPERVVGVVFMDGSWSGPIELEERQRRKSAEVLVREGFSDIVRKLFADMFTTRTDDGLRVSILNRALAFDEAYAAGLFTDATEWDWDHLEAAVCSLSVPILAVQSTFLNLQQHARVPIRPGDSTPWLEVLKTKAQHEPQIEIVPNAGHFNMIEAAPAVNAIMDNFISSLTNATQSRAQSAGQA